jgi:N6-L-threonylcarbamoyladenine synthase
VNGTKQDGAATSGLILGIESSCDETAAAIVARGETILSSVVASQIELHRKYGGVVPELASREHLRRIVPIVRAAASEAKLELRDVDAIAVTRGPGLVGSLIVGVTYGKALAMSLGKPLIAVNHLEGHVHAVLLEARLAGRAPEYPAVCLIVSGGHTILYRVIHAGADGYGNGIAQRLNGAPLKYGRIGGTRDDAAGEAYDKVAKMLAPFGDPAAIRFAITKIRGNAYDFSFSGIKTAVFYLLRKHPELQPEIDARIAALARGERSVDAIRPLCSKFTLDLVASFQRSVVEDLVRRTMGAAEEFKARAILVSGGVAANRALRVAFDEAGARSKLGVYFPSRALSTDNAAMIAAAAYPRFLAGEFADVTLNAEANLPLA